MNHFVYNNLSITLVIASFDFDGHMKPLYVRIGKESFKVHSSFIKSSYVRFF